MAISGDWDRRISRRTLLRSGGSLAAGVTLAGIASGPAFAQAELRQLPLHARRRLRRPEPHRRGALDAAGDGSARRRRRPAGRAVRGARSRSPVTRTSTRSSARGPPSRCRTRRTASASRSSASGRGTSTSTASRPGTTSARSAARAPLHPATRWSRAVTFAFVSCQNFADGHFTAVRRRRRAAGRRGRHPPRRLHLRGRRQGRCGRTARGARSRRSTTTGSATASTRPTRTSRRRTPRTRGSSPGTTTSSRTTTPTRTSTPNVPVEARARPPGGRVPGVLGAHAARARSQARGPRPPALSPLPLGPAGHVQRARRAPVPLGPAPGMHAAERDLSGHCAGRPEPRAHDARRRAARLAARGSRDHESALERARAADRLRAVQPRDRRRLAQLRAALRQLGRLRGRAPADPGLDRRAAARRTPSS